MKRLGGVWHDLTSFGNLLHAYKKARAGKMTRVAVGQFSFNLEKELITLQRSLREQSYQPGEFRQFEIYDRKPRLISAIKDRKVLWLVDRIIDQSPVYDVPATLFPGDDLVSLMQRKRGLPIGNLTSQIFANLYLTALDFHLKQQCSVPAYLRYVDDCVLLADSKQALWDYHAAIQQFLQSERLLLHPNKTYLQPTRRALSLLGYRVSPSSIRLGNGGGYRYRRRLKVMAKQFQRGQISLPEVTQSVAAWKGYAQQADSLQLRKAVFSDIIFSKGSASIPFSSCVARRRLEQQTREPSFCKPQQEQSR